MRVILPRPSRPAHTHHTSTLTHLESQPRQFQSHVLHGFGRDCCSVEVDLSQVVAPVRKRPGARVADLCVPELNLAQMFAVTSERLDSFVGDLYAIVQVYKGHQDGARVHQRFYTHVRDVRVGELNLGEKDARGSKRSGTRVGDLLVVAIASALVLVLPGPLDQRFVVGGRWCWRRRCC